MYALQCEPETRSRWGILASGAVLGAALFGVSLCWAAQIEPHPKPVADRVIRMRVVETPRPERPAPPPKESPVVPPAPPEPAKKHLPKEPRPTTAPPPKETTPAPAPLPLALGLTLSSTTQGGHGAKFAVGDSLMGEPDRIAHAPRPPRRAAVPRAGTDAPVAVRAPLTNNRTSVAAKLQRSTMPVYPLAAKNQGLEGVVVLAITIGPDGRVEDVRVLRGLGFGLDESALKAARQTQWQPATLDGQPIRSTRRFNVRFTLQS
jgi:protein TonB